MLMIFNNTVVNTNEIAYATICYDYLEVCFKTGKSIYISSNEKTTKDKIKECKKWLNEIITTDKNEQ